MNYQLVLPWMFLYFLLMVHHLMSFCMVHCSSYNSISLFFIDLHLPLSGFSLNGLCDVSFPSICFDESNSSNLASFINNIYEYDYAYIYIFNKLEDGSQMHIIKSVEVNINDDPMNPKIVYLEDVLDEWERVKWTRLLNKYAKVFTHSYTYMHGMDPNVIIHNIFTLLNVNPIKKKPRRIDPIKSI